MGKPYERFILVLCTMIIVLFSALMASCDGEHPAQAPKPDDGWVKIGAVSDSSGGCTVWKKKDDNGKTVYVAIGVNACSICAVEDRKP